MRKIGSLLKNYQVARKILRRNFSQAEFKEKFQQGQKMLAWQIHSYGDRMQLSEARIPVLDHPQELLVKVDAASVNPIDKLILAGYGRTLLNIFRRYKLEFPLTVGRDFSGTVVDKGFDVGNKLNVGDQVYGFLPLHRPGSHAEAVLVHKNDVCLKPPNLSSVEAASIPYVAMTAWSALFLTGELCVRSARGAKILILGASGGVGTMATQILRSQGAVITGTCATDAIPLVRSMGADYVVDYKSADYLEQVASKGSYDIILDCAKFGYQNAPPDWKYKYYVTLNSPLMVNTDKYGLFGGLAASANSLISTRIKGGKAVRWAYFVPSKDGFKFVDKLVKNGQILPVIHKVFGFEDVPAAFEAMSVGHLRGKIVINCN